MNNHAQVPAKSYRANSNASDRAPADCFRKSSASVRHATRAAALTFLLVGLAAAQPFAKPVRHEAVGYKSASSGISIFAPSAGPTDGLSGSDGITVGVKFRSDVGGTVTGVRFYKAPGNNVAHLGLLYSNSGALLAQATYSGETSSGWQQVDFSSPVSITANTTYVAALFTTTFSGTQSYFAGAGVDNAPLHALRSGVDGGNGVYTYAGTPQFPVSSWSDTNYWVDVVFTPAQVATPSFSPNPGSYTSQQQVTVADSTSGAAIRYTLDGSTPTSTTGAVYAGPITISSTTTVKAIAYAAGMLDSPVVTATYTINTGAASVSIFAPSAAPADPPSTTDPLTVGVKFRSDVAGTVTGIRFYKGAGNNGLHIGLLYNSAGTLLAQATFTGETASGWQQVDFSTPVTIAAGTTYVAAYFTTGLSATVNGFTSAGVDNAPLHALRSGIDGGNGLYTYGASPQFPVLTWADCNYWVDLAFSPSTPPPVSAPTPTVVTPSSDIGLSQVFTAGFQDPVSYSNITEAQIMVQNGQNAANSCNARYAAGNFWLRNDGDTAWLGPLTAQTPLENTQCVLNGGTWSNATGTGVTLTVNYALSFKSGFDGPKNIYLRAANAGADSGWVLKTSNWNIAPVAQLPVNESVTPSSGFGLTQTFQATSTSPNGYPYITRMEMIVNYGVTLGGSCFLLYSPPSNTIILVNDDGNIPWQGGVLLGSTGALDNSQCHLDLAGSSRSFSFNKVSLNLALTFKAGLPGPQKIFMATTDGSGQSQYQTMGTWTTTTVNSQGPSAVSVSPNPGVPAMTQAFTYTARSVNGWDYIANMYMKLSPTLASDQACVLYFSRWEGVWLNDDAGNIFSQHARLGAPGAVLHNSRCTLDAEHSSWSYSGTDLSMTLQFIFDPSFVGAKTQYMYVTDRGNNVTDWQQVGTFTVGSSPDFNLTVGPASSAVMPGGSTNYSVVVTPSNNFTGVVTLSAANLPAGVTGQFNPPTLTASGTSTMTLSATSGTQAVTSTVTVTATSGSLVHNATSSLVVQDFSIGISPGTASTLPGGTASYTLTVSPH